MNGSSLTSINVSNFDTSNISYMDFIFSDCSKLTSINLSNFDTSKVTIIYCMFFGCSKLQFIDISYFSFSGSNPYLFDQDIPFNGTIITNEDFKNKINKDYLNDWEWK